MEILGRVAFDHPNITQTVQNYFQLNNFLGALSAKVIPEYMKGTHYIIHHIYKY
jgi:hypothetical protein